MKIGVVSDTHGNTQAVERVVAMLPDAALWLHAGDYISDGEYLELLADTGVVKVAGNGDWPHASEPYEKVVEAAGHKIFLTHGHTHGVNYGTDILLKDAAAADCDIAIYGHTHRVDVREGKITIINPGSASRPRDEHRPSFIIMELTEGQKPAIEVIRLEDE